MQVIYDIKPPVKINMPINNISINEDIIYVIKKNNFEAQRVINLKNAKIKEKQAHKINSKQFK